MSELPKGWATTKFTDYLDVNGGTQPPKKDFLFEETEGYIRLLQIRDFGKKPVPTYVPLTKKLRLCGESDILIGRYGASLGRICTGMEGCYNVALAKVAIPELIQNKFVKYYLESELFQHPLRLLSRSAQNGFNKQDLGEFDFPLAPLAEQKRIVEKLDEVLAQVDTIKARLDGIPDLLKRFRQSVLASAVSGKLTEEWRGSHQASESVIESYEEFKDREINDASTLAQRNKIIKTHRQVESSEFPLKVPDSWLLKNLNKLALGFNYGSSAKSQPSGEVPVLRMGNIQRGKLDWDSLVYTSDIEEIEKYRLVKGDVLFNRTNSPELVGKTTIYQGEREAIYAGYLIKVQGTEILNSEFLNVALNSVHAKNYCLSVKTDGVSQSNINAQKLGAFPCPLPPIDEQKEIVRLVDQYFAFADTIEAQVKKAQARVDNLTQSILAKAFRGELVAQDPTDEPADKLLERIAQARAEAEALAKAAKKAESTKKRAAKKATQG